MTAFVNRGQNCNCSLDKEKVRANWKSRPFEVVQMVVVDVTKLGV